MALCLCWGWAEAVLARVVRFPWFRVGGWLVEMRGEDLRAPPPEDEPRARLPSPTRRDKLDCLTGFKV